MQQPTTRANPSEEIIKIGPLGIRFLLTGDDSNGSASVFEVLVPTGQKLAAPAHKNDAYEEILYGIKGVLTWTVDGTPIEVGPGQALCIPRGAVHRFDNLGNYHVFVKSTDKSGEWSHVELIIDVVSREDWARVKGIDPATLPSPVPTP